MSLPFNALHVYFTLQDMTSGFRRVLQEFVQLFIIGAHQNTDVAATRLAEVRALGPRIALDDFGTGFSSLSYLRALPVDLIKIAQPFIRDMTGGDPTFVSAIVGLGQKLGFTTVAEGIEEERAVDMLQGIGCDLGQGYHFAHPMELGELTKLLARRTAVPPA